MFSEKLWSLGKNVQKEGDKIIRVAKPTPWRERSASCKIPEEDAEHEARMKVKFKEWHAQLTGRAKGPRA